MMNNELFGWVSVLASLAMGLYMGAKFQREDWLGGYAALFQNSELYACEV